MCMGCSSQISRNADVQGETIRERERVEILSACVLSVCHENCAPKQNYKTDGHAKGSDARVCTSRSNCCLHKTKRRLKQFEQYKNQYILNVCEDLI